MSDVVDLGCGAVGKGPSGSGLAECAAWPVIVVMVRVLLQHGRGVSLVDDQQGTEEFPAEGAEEAFGDRVARGALDRASTAGSASPIGSFGPARPDRMLLVRARRGPATKTGRSPLWGMPRHLCHGSVRMRRVWRRVRRQ